MATDWQQKELRKAVERGLAPLKDSIDVVSAEVFALRETIDRRRVDELEGRIEQVYREIGRFKSLLDQRMESFHKKLHSRIARRMGDSGQ